MRSTINLILTLVNSNATFFFYAVVFSCESEIGIVAQVAKVPEKLIFITKLLAKKPRLCVIEH